MEKQTLQAEVREGRGKGPARQLRAAGKVPAVLYGPGGEPQNLSLDPKDLNAALSTPYRRNVLIDLQVAGVSTEVMVKELQIHPVSREIRHADLYRLAADREVSISVPLHTTGRAAGVAAGGKLYIRFRDLPVRCLPSAIPAEVLVDVSALEMLGSMTVKDLPISEGITVDLPEDRICVVCEADRQTEETGDEEEGASEGDEAPPAS